MAGRAPARKLRPREAAGRKARAGEPVAAAGSAPAEARDVSTGLAVTAAAEAIGRFLDALVPPGERGAASLEGTPERVAQAWLQDLLDGYRRSPAAILGDVMPSAGEDLVAVTGIDFHSVCPHHLLPSRGVAHVAYVPGDKVVGFGQIARLVDCFAHRLVLEEDLARQVAGSLVSLLGARGAACILDAEQACLTVRGARRPGARTHVQCFVGALDSDRHLRARFLALAGDGRSTSGRSGAVGGASPAGQARRGAGKGDGGRREGRRDERGDRPSRTGRREIER